jgi:hypothetical protein
VASVANLAQLSKVYLRYRIETFVTLISRVDLEIISTDEN